MKRIKLCAAALILALLVAGCGESLQAEELSLPVGFSLPEKQVYALGEATHGSAEFTMARQNVFAYLVRERGVRAFCLEADFGEGLKINGLLHGETWNAKSTTKQFAFWIYQSQEMANFMQWMREYNDTVTPQEQVRFYGIDCQQWDDSLGWLHTYLQQVAPETAELLEREPFAAISDKTLNTLGSDEIASGVKGIETLLQWIRAQRGAYISASSEREYDIALRAAESMRQCLLIRRAGEGINKMFDADMNEEEQAKVMAQATIAVNMRDAYMAEHVGWILEHEKKYYSRSTIFITGHNGHIVREDGNSGATVLGEYLAKQYEEQYYAIGTDFGRGWFKAVDIGGARRLRVFELDWQRPISEFFAGTEEQVAFVDFLQAHGAAKELFSSPQQMHFVGSVFSDEMRKNPSEVFPSIVPAEAYNALLYFQQVHAFRGVR